MLKTLDMLIGLSVVMLIFSMAVMVLTQLAVAIVNARAKALKDGIASLLSQLDGTLSSEEAAAIAKMLLKHPLVANSQGFFQRAATVIHREELTQLLMHVATPPVVGAAVTPENNVHAMLTKGGITNPDATLKAIQTTSVALEKTNPDMAHDARMNAAILNQADSPIVAKINAWFDGTVDRVAARFTALARVWSVVIAVLLVVVVQLDVFMVINRLSTDDAAREAAVRQAVTMVASSPEQQVSQTVDKTLKGSGTLTLADLHFDGLVADDLIQIPGSFDDWTQQWVKTPTIRHAAGMLTSIALLCLGAPFWYNILKNLLQLRSIIANKDDTQRQVRQDQQSAPQPPAALTEGEKGDLAAVG